MNEHIDRIRAALARYQAATTLAETLDAVGEFEDAASADVMPAVLAHIDVMQAEIELLRADAELWRKHDADTTARYARFIAKLNDGETL